MAGFDKIDIDSNTAASRKLSLKKLKGLAGNKKILAAIIIILFLVFLSVFSVILPGFKTYQDAKKTYAQVKLVESAIKVQDVDLAATQLQQTRVELTQTQKDLNSMFLLKFIPIANWYYSDATHLVKAGFYGLDAANILVESVKPYADVLGLKGKGSFVGGTASQRIETAVQTMGKITPKIDDINNSLILVKGEIDQVDPNHYPPIFGGQKVKNTLAQLRTLTDQSVSFISEAKPLIKILPGLLGEPNAQKYLVIFQNDKELRPTGGFITAYSIFNVQHGVIHVDTSSDIYALDATIANKPAAPRLILDYLPKVYQLNLRDTNLSPDYKVSMDTFQKMYRQAGGYVPVQGIIAVDTHALVAAMNILGDIQAGGETFTTKTNPVCNCADVIYKLEQYADQPLGVVNAGRKDIIGELMYAIMNKAFSSSPKLYWGPLFQTALFEVDQKHILFDLYNQDAQSGLEALNAAGRIMPFGGDYLHINEANFGGAKSNMFVTESVTQDYSLGSDGTVTKTVTINYKNPFPPSDCNLERGGLCLNAVLRDLVRVYVPKGSQLLSSRGSEVKMTTYEDLGKTVFEGFLTINPQGAAKFMVSYKLPFKLDTASLPLMLQKQPGTNGFDYLININGKKFDEFTLSSDKTLTLNLK